MVIEICGTCRTCRTRKKKNMRAGSSAGSLEGSDVNNFCLLHARRMLGRNQHPHAPKLRWSAPDSTSCPQSAHSTCHPTPASTPPSSHCGVFLYMEALGAAPGLGIPVRLLSALGAMCGPRCCRPMASHLCDSFAGSSLLLFSTGSCIAVSSPCCAILALAGACSVLLPAALFFLLLHHVHVLILVPLSTAALLAVFCFGDIISWVTGRISCRCNLAANPQPLLIHFG